MRTALLHSIAAARLLGAFVATACSSGGSPAKQEVASANEGPRLKDTTCDKMATGCGIERSSLSQGTAQQRTATRRAFEGGTAPMADGPLLRKGMKVDAIIHVRRCIRPDGVDTVTASIVLPQLVSSPSPEQFPRLFEVKLVLPDPATIARRPITSSTGMLEKVSVAPGAIAELSIDAEQRGTWLPRHCYGSSERLIGGVLTRTLRY
jgi:hypothetical protein